MEEIDENIISINRSVIIIKIGGKKYINLEKIMEYTTTHILIQVYSYMHVIIVTQRDYR